MAVRQAKVPEIPKRASFILSVSTTVALIVALKWLKSDSGARRRHTIPTMILRTANVPAHREFLLCCDFHLAESSWSANQVKLWKPITAIVGNHYRCITRIYLGPSGEQCPWRSMGWGGRKRSRDRWQEEGLPAEQKPCLGKKLSSKSKDVRQSRLQRRASARGHLNSSIRTRKGMTDLGEPEWCQH